MADVRDAGEQILKPAETQSILAKCTWRGRDEHNDRRSFAIPQNALLAGHVQQIGRLLFGFFKGVSNNRPVRLSTAHHTIMDDVHVSGFCTELGYIQNSSLTISYTSAAFFTTRLPSLSHPSHDFSSLRYFGSIAFA